MNCATVKEWIPLYIDGLLSPEVEQSVRLHMMTCPDCAHWLDEAREMAEIWSEMDRDRSLQNDIDVPDLTAGVMAYIGKLENGRRERAATVTMARRRTMPRTSWVHYGVAACLTVILVQFGVFENLAYGITEINGHMSNTVSAWFGPGR
ncbi:anti-sigma factor family protein [Paenibacillus donghaensis]|nr:zf-HC2 domain-containing protein [Paenibacillus donghaensis]